MAVALTSDPIVTEQLALDILKWPSADEVRLAINSVSARFLRYTNRLRITDGAVTEYQCGRGLSYFWLHATPVITITSIEVYSLGDLYETYGASDRTVNLETGHVYLHAATVAASDERNIKAVYTGGWTTVPYDVQQSALALMRLDKARLDGRLGVQSEGREGFSASYETGDLPSSVADVWRAYRFLA